MRMIDETCMSGCMFLATVLSGLSNNFRARIYIICICNSSACALQ